MQYRGRRLVWINTAAAFAVAIGVPTVWLATAAAHDVEVDPSAYVVDPLPSWNEGAARRAIIDFVTRVTTPGTADFVPAAERIAVFDNDGTLWIEKPLYVQAVFAADQLKRFISLNPQLRSKEPFKSAFSDPTLALGNGNGNGDGGAGNVRGKLTDIAETVKLSAATHEGMTIEEYDRTVKSWLEAARHPRFNRKYTELVYKPMLELLTYLRQNGFRTFIVSGGGVEFMRTFSEAVYGVPTENVIGSYVKTKFELRNGTPVVVRLPEVGLVNDGPGKPSGIEQGIGRRPIAAFGNSDGDLEMLQYTTMGPGPRFGLIVHHTDGVREYAYDRDSHVGRLDEALNQAPARGWIVVSMKDDWKAIF